MNTTDYLVIAAIVISALVGVMRGFLREAIALVTWIIALFLAWHFSTLVAPHLGGLLADAEVRAWAARVIIVLLVLLLGAAGRAPASRTSCGCRSSAAWTACSASCSGCCAASCCSACLSFSVSCCAWRASRGGGTRC